MPSPTPAFECVNRCLGWGEPARALWFIGLEEGSDSTSASTQAEVIEWYAARGNPEFLPCDDAMDYSTLKHEGALIRSYTSRIANAVSRSPENTWQEYRTRRLWKTGCRLFQANLYPLGKARRRDWGSNFGELYGFSDRETYETHVRRTRFAKIKLLWKQSEAQAVVCFGKEAWEDCRKIFDVKSLVEVIAEGTIHVHRPEKVILTPFFANGHMSKAKATEVATRLGAWGVEIP
jgi:hypothetical protein